MNNEKMTFAGLKELENVLHRNLTDIECAIGYSKNCKALLEYIGLTEDKLESFNDLYDMMIAYFTMNRLDFEKYCNTRTFKCDIADLLSNFIEDSGIFDEKEGFEIESPDDDNDNEIDYERLVNNVCDFLKKNLSEEDNFWVAQYIDMDPAMPELTSYIKSLCDDEATHYFEDELPSILKKIKITVVKKTIDRLVTSGKEEELPEPLLSHVCENIEKNMVNYSMRVVNNKIRVKKF